MLIYTFLFIFMAKGMLRHAIKYIWRIFSIFCSLIFLNPQGLMTLCHFIVIPFINMHIFCPLKKFVKISLSRKDSHSFSHDSVVIWALSFGGSWFLGNMSYWVEHFPSSQHGRDSCCFTDSCSITGGHASLPFSQRCPLETENCWNLSFKVVQP